ncbi:MAG TPA: hypothetical protein VFB20_10025 [Burkholderiales bacterium]|nr:hypothetical protein [Burkholderiales bacterium]
MRKSCRAFLLLVFMGLSAGSLSAELLDLVPPNQAVAGTSQAEWSRRWWQWAVSFDDADSPVADRTGDKCRLKQEGSVWFLAGTYGTKRTIRTCTVPGGKYLFFPLVNYVVFPRGDAKQSSCESLLRTAKEMTDEVASLVLDLNGLRATGLEAHRQATADCFDLGARMVPRVHALPAAANGYYVMLKPLPPGKYELNFGGILPSMIQAVTYHLVVQ